MNSTDVLGSVYMLHQDNVRYYMMMKVVLMCAPSGQCQVLHDEGSLNVCSIRTMSGIT